ncbi:hypothetical protein SELMODRAFT_168968 [Selaginella moellendorffii]|uniref:Uncharacterized protein n=1 Tax=Selaginella moellendorffii TaxID=88036 RepID=D8R883_SELML|nr:uncharacterized protein LOC9632136 [Selaginella moellendorffii]EFJ31653.1 hypothetical protein SELMODRAFT_168968 [Selaginella moellendorffii]|eukprot:XP_002967054.1 uncharacterized protein LOC9632136 [Selaginella moellendorffii]
MDARASSSALRGAGVIVPAPAAWIHRRRRHCAAISSSGIESPSLARGVTDNHGNFVRNVAGLEPPTQLQMLLDVLQAKGEQVVSPEKRQGLHPLAIPLSQNSTGTITALLRWPTPPEGMAIPVVEVHTYGLCLLSKSVEQYVQKILVEEEVHGRGDACYSAAVASAGGDPDRVPYKRGDFENSKLAGLDVYLMKKVGLFPDVFERLALKHLEKGDEVSALVTGEFYVTKKHFPGFGRPLVFNAELMLKIGRKSEAKDAARIALKSPWWTLGCEYKTVAEIAGWGDEKVEYMREKMTEEGRKEELNKGKAPEQVALDQAAFLLDLGTVDGNWDEISEKLASFYTEAGLDTIAKFVALQSEM